MLAHMTISITVPLIIPNNMVFGARGYNKIPHAHEIPTAQKLPHTPKIAYSWRLQAAITYVKF